MTGRGQPRGKQLRQQGICAESRRRGQDCATKHARGCVLSPSSPTTPCNSTHTLSLLLLLLLSSSFAVSHNTPQVRFGRVVRCCCLRCAMCPSCTCFGGWAATWAYLDPHSALDRWASEKVAHIHTCVLLSMGLSMASL